MGFLLLVIMLLLSLPTHKDFTIEDKREPKLLKITLVENDTGRATTIVKDCMNEDCTSFKTINATTTLKSIGIPF